jgi:hypothetical protein
MQIKTIKQNITAKLNEWLATIKDQTLRDDLKKNILVSGGCITSMLLNEQVNDYDIYIYDIDVLKRLTTYYIKSYKQITLLDGRNKEILVNDLETDYRNLVKATALAIDMNTSYAISLRNLKPDQIKLYFAGAQGGMKVNEAMPKEELNYTPLYFSPNAISLSNNLQIVIRFWGTAEQIHQTFDFIHATNYFTFADGLVTNIAALESILTKQLKYQGSYYPVTSIIRAKKFIKKGFNINAGELLKIMFQISQLNLSSPDVLEEQLIGVDVAYFDLLITALRNKQTSDDKFKLSSQYLNILIDKIFNESEDL